MFAEYFHNHRNTARNRVTRFGRPSDALSLDRLIVVATRASASASELVINSLRPFMPVWIIGDRTYGKPVGQYGTRFCDKVLAAVSFTLQNADSRATSTRGCSRTAPRLTMSSTNSAIRSKDRSVRR